MVECTLTTGIEENDKRTYTVAEIARILGIGRTSAYKFVNEKPDFKVVKIGHSIRISKNSFDNWLNSRQIIY